MGALRCPMCCKRKFKTQTSLKFHILSYMYNIFCTLCSKRVGTLQELIDHLDDGCEKAYSASFERGPVFKHAIVQTQEELFDVGPVEAGSLFKAREVQVEEVEGPLCASSSDDSCCSWSLVDCQDEGTADPLADGDQSGDAAPARRASSRQLFTCNVCRTTFTDIDEHARVHHSEQDVEVHRRDLSIQFFCKTSRREVNDITFNHSQQRSAGQDSALDGEHQQARGIVGVRECNKKPNDLYRALPNGDDSFTSVGNASVNKNVKMSSNQRSFISRNNRDTEHAYSSSQIKTGHDSEQASRSLLIHEKPIHNVSSDKTNIEESVCSNSDKNNMLCVCSPSNHQHGAKQQPSPAIDFSEAIPKIFSQKNGKEIPTVVVFSGNRLTSILTPMTSSINLKTLKKCTSLSELVNAIGSQTGKTYPRAVNGESIYRDGNILSSSEVIQDSSANSKPDCPSTNESNLSFSADKETSQEGGVHNDKQKLTAATIRKKIRNQREFIVKKSVDSDGKFLDNVYTCRNCGLEFQKYLSFCKHVCGKVTNYCDSRFTKERILTINFKDKEPEAETQNATIEIGLGVDTELSVPSARDSSEVTNTTEVTDAASKGGSADVHNQIKACKKRKRVRPQKEVLPLQPMICHICSTVFTKRSAFVGHQRMHAPKVARRIALNADGTPVIFTCEICSFVAEHKQGYNQHMRVHFPEEYEQRCAERRDKLSKGAESKRPVASEQEQEDVGVQNDLDLSCNLCGMVFSKYIHLDEHVRSHYHNVDEYAESESTLVDAVVERAVATVPCTFTCEICSKTMDVVFRQLHIKTHLGDERFTCEICNENLYTREQFNLHMRAHKGDNPYLCRVCKRKFGSPEDLGRHILSHNGPKRYPCRFCNRRFKQPFSKVEHERLHTGEKPFSCSYCGMKFRLKGTREIHVRIHTGIKPYCCKVCKKSFRSKYNLRDHEATHSDERNYKCSICPKTFKTAVSLSSHKNNHTKPYKCPVCQRRFETAYAERQHRHSHYAAKSTLKYKCTVCGIMYARSFGLRDHMLTHTVTPEQPLNINGDKIKKMSLKEEIEIVDSESAQMADLALRDLNDECMEAAEFLVNANEDGFENPRYTVQVANKSEVSSQFIVDYPEKVHLQESEFVSSAAEDKDHPGSVLAVSDFTSDAYFIAGDGDECQQLLLVETTEGSTSSQYILAVANEDLLEVPNLDLSDIYSECEPSREAKLKNQQPGDFSNSVTVERVSAEENVCVPPAPVNFEEV
ncbi:uncharacterized protein LOC134534063 isoform X2 [Bacillus rossius redtenbacheri]